MSAAAHSQSIAKASLGIVAFLDILGYQNFIDNNSPEKAVEILSDVFDGLKRAVADDYKASWTNKKASSDRLNAIEIQTLSDSLILHLAAEENEITETDWVTFLQMVRVLQRRLFDHGFPARGGIAFGKYFFAQRFLVGKPFMDAYRLSTQLEFASTALTPQAFENFRQQFQGTYRGGVEFLAPLKGGKEERLFCLSPLRWKEIKEKIADDLPGYVNRAFWQHRKDVAASVDAKVFNTTKFLNYWVWRRRDEFP